MRRIRCYECGKSYNYDEDCFCPKCGAYNQPAKSASIDAQGRVVRVEGINERNHEGSFVHAELHGENRERRGTPLAKGVKRTARPAVSKPQTFGSQTKKKSPVSVIVWVIFAIIALNVLSSILVLFI